MGAAHVQLAACTKYVRDHDVAEWAARMSDAPELLGEAPRSWRRRPSWWRRGWWRRGWWRRTASARTTWSPRESTTVRRGAARVRLCGAAVFPLEMRFGPQMRQELLEDTQPVAVLVSAATCGQVTAALTAAAVSASAHRRPPPARAAEPWPPRPLHRQRSGAQPSRRRSIALGGSSVAPRRGVRRTTPRRP